MKVTVCPKCKLTPEIDPKKIKCPKCGRFSVGENLAESLTKWNNGDVTNGKSVEAIVSDEEVAKSFIEDVESVKDQLPEDTKPVRRTSKRRGTK